MQFSTTGASKGAIQRATAVPMLSVVVLSALCIVCTIGLLMGAFQSEPSNGLDITCISPDDKVASETFNVLLMFALGYLSSLAMKHRRLLGRQTHNVICLSNEMVSSTSARVASMVARVRSSGQSFQLPSWMSKDVIAIFSAATLCSLCIGGLVISAFMVEADADPTDSGLASESSTSMKAFTLGWMFVLSFKLRGELIGCVGSSWLLQPI